MRFLKILLLFISFSSTAQQLSYRTADSITYNQLIKKHYHELKIIGKIALKQKIDFYYLRMRLGIAYYEQKNYEKALPHFEKAIAMNPADTSAQEYLYYTYLFSGRQEDAGAYASKLSTSMQKRVHYKKKKIDAFAIEAGFLLTENVKQRGNKNIIGDENIYAEALYNGNVTYANAFLKHTVFNRLKLCYGAAVFNTKADGVIQSTDSALEKKFNNYHYQYNFAASYQFKKGWNLTGALAFYQMQISNLVAEYNDLTFQYSYSTSYKQLNSFAGNLSVSKRFRFIQPILSGTVSNFLDSKQYQGELLVHIYPFGNPNFYSTSAVAFVKNGQSKELIYSQKLGGKIFNWLGYEAKVSYGDHTNFITQNGFLTYNTANPVNLVAGATFNIFYKNLEIVPGYIFNQRQGSILHYTFTPDYLDVKTETINYTYFYHLLTATIKWNF